ncbi:MAG: hypothetical protein ACTSYL_00730 [Candidatus Thorarchaeota archaeon]
MVIAYLEKHGYTILSHADDSWELWDKSSKLIIRGPVDGSVSQYYGGAVSPSERVVLKSHRFQKALKFFSATLIISFLLVIIFWVVAFIAGVSGVWSVVELIDYLMHFVFWWAIIINPLILIILFIFNDLLVARNNRREYEHIHRKLVNIFTSYYPELTLINEEIKTKLTDLRTILTDLSSARRKQLHQLGFRIDSPL